MVPPQNHQFEDDECSICLESITKDDRVGVIPSCDCRISNQNYHHNCIVKWASNSNSCPQCRKRFYKINIYQKVVPIITNHTITTPSTLKLIQSYTVKDKLLKNDAIDNIPAEFIIPSSMNQDHLLSLAANRISATSTSSTTTTTTSNSSTRPNSSTIVSDTSDPILNGVCVICSSSNYNFRSSLVNCTHCMSNFHYSCINHNINSSHANRMGGDGDGSSNGVIDDYYFQWCCPICDSDQESLIPYSSRVRKIVRHKPTVTTIRRRTTTNTTFNKTRKARPCLTAFDDANYTGDDFDFNDVEEDDDDDIYDNRNHNYDDLMFDDEYNDEIDVINETALLPNNPHDTYSSNSTTTAANHYPQIINGGVLLRKELRAQENLTKEELKSWELFDHVRNHDDDIQDINMDKSDSSGDNGGKSGNTVNQTNNNIVVNNAMTASIGKKRKKRKRTVINDIGGGDDTSMVGSISTLSMNNSHPTRISNLLNQLKTTTTTTSVSSSSISPIQSSSSRGSRSTNVFSSPPQFPSQSQNSPIISISESPSSISPMSNSPMELNDSDTQYESDFSKHRKRQLPPLPPPPPPPPPRFELSLDQKVEIQKYIRNNLRPLYNPLQLNSKIKDEDHYININKTISRKIYSHIINESKKNNVDYYAGSISDSENYEDDIDMHNVESYFNQGNSDKLITIINKYVEEELSKI
ncbi:hypothetical protein DFJ63DRAFT_333655 [Scheffersomyces coipomensis]|uniref:uncharacterized protein n=1 Tax=Scheffersomyces coipomensis TaxID=1788519 RepID=UPI00315DB8D9